MALRAAVTVAGANAAIASHSNSSSAAPSPALRPSTVPIPISPFLTPSKLSTSSMALTTVGPAARAIGIRLPESPSQDRAMTRAAGNGTPTRQHTEKLKLYVEPSETGELHIFSGNSNRELAAEVAAKLDMQCGRFTARRFADGEVNVVVHDSVRGNDIFVIQSTCPPINDNLAELIFTVAALRRSSARTITAVIPYFGYSRQDVQHDESQHESIGAADVAIMLETVGVDRIISFDLHNAQIEGFFSASVPVDNLMPYVAAIPYFAKKRLVAPVIVAPAAGGVQRAKKFLDNFLLYGLDASLAFVVPNSKRDQQVPDVAPHHASLTLASDDMVLIGQVSGSDAIIVDDMIDSGSRVIKAAEVLIARGAQRIFAFCTHGLFSGDALQRIADSPLTEVVVTNTISVREYSRKVRHLSVSGLLAETIRRIFNHESVSEVYKMPMV